MKIDDLKDGDPIRVVFPFNSRKCSNTAADGL